MLTFAIAELNKTDLLRIVTSKTSNATAIISGSVVLFLSLIGNFLVVTAFFRNKTLRTPVHCFIVNMAISDLIIPVVYLPLVIAEEYNDGLWMFDGVLGNLLCKLQMVAWGISNTVSILSMVSIAVDRFHSILFAMRPPLISRKTCLLVIVIMWITSTVLRAPIIYTYRVVRKDTGIYYKFHWDPAFHKKTAKRISELLFLVLSAVSAVVLTVLYSSIIIFLHKQKNSIHMASEMVKCRAKENRKVTCMLVMVVIVFYVVWIPYHVRFFLLYFIPNVKLPSLLRLISIDFPSLYTVINPIIYFLFNEKYHQGFKDFLSFKEGAGCYQED